MEEKVIIKSERYGLKRPIFTVLIIGIVLSAIMFSIFRMVNSGDYYFSCAETYSSHQSRGYCYDRSDPDDLCFMCEMIKENPTYIGYLLSGTQNYEILFSLIPLATFTLLSALLYFWLRSYELTVTNKRVYGKVAWGKRVDLPVDSVSAISSTRLLKGVSVSTSSGRISFRLIKNASNIYEAINALLIERQHEKANTTVVAPPSHTDEADQLK